MAEQEARIDVMRVLDLNGDVMPLPEAIENEVAEAVLEPLPPADQIERPAHNQDQNLQ